jgi:superfamily II DNA or RNA helicase
LFERDSTPAIDWLLQTPPAQIGWLRTYQQNCILAVEKEIIADRRDLMVAMATGTGKTFLTVVQIYRLLESKLVRKILFLVDRKALAAHSFLVSFEDEPSWFSTPQVLSPKALKFASHTDLWLSLSKNPSAGGVLSVNQTLVQIEPRDFRY